jgi:hypothetical protein
MGFINRTELPRCEYGVTNGYVESTCDAPAVALWHWSSKNSMYVCERHDLVIQDAEVEDDS